MSDYEAVMKLFARRDRNDLPPAIRSVLYRQAHLGEPVLKPIEKLRNTKDLAEFLVRGRMLGSRLRFFFRLVSLSLAQ